MKKKLVLNDLKVTSFSTLGDQQAAVRGGDTARCDGYTFNTCGDGGCTFGPTGAHRCSLDPPML